jgi:translation initiation factor IF-3
VRQRYTPQRSFNSQKPRMNEQIRVPEVLLISDEGEPRRMTTLEAIALAKEQELDLIEVSPKAVPPVVKIGDYGSYLYKLKKKEKQQKAHSKQTEVKSIRFGFRTDTGDLDRQADRSREFLAERHMVKVTIVMRGRELTNKEYGITKLNKFVQSLHDVAEVDQPIKRQGSHFMVILRPRRSPLAPKEPEQQA